MSSKDQDGPSGHCGLSDMDVRNILNAVDDSDMYISEEEPFIDSGSEYIPDSESELSSGENDESLLDDENTEEQQHSVASASDISDHSIRQEEFQIIWDSREFVPKVHQFDDTNSGLQNENLKNKESKIEYFMKLFSEEIVNIIIEETNIYAQQQDAKGWKNVDKNEFYNFIALSMLMPHVKKSDIKDYGSTNNLIGTPSFRQTMSRDRYLEILRYLHFSNNQNEQEGNRLHKIENVLNMIQNNFKSIFYPFQNIVIDESMILFKGRLSFKQYIKTKRHRFGIKLYVLCDCETGYVLGFLVYTGKNTNKTRDNNSGLGLSGDVVVKLLEPYLGKGHSFYSDNYYTSPTLSNYVFVHKTNSCGTVRINRKHMPIFEKKIKKGETEWRSSDSILALKWKDRRDVVMLTTIHENKMVTLPQMDRLTNEHRIKPLCVLDYNERMGAVDRSDMMMSITDCTRKTLKWYKKLFFHTLDICMLNAHALYKTQNASNILFPAFHLDVIGQLLERYPTNYQMKKNMQPTNVARLSGKHFPSEVPRKNGKPQIRRCWVCSHTTNANKKRKESRFMCRLCDVGLCAVPCFQIYHEKIKY